jgi:hypothetical protein
MSGFYSRAAMRQAREERESREVGSLPEAAAPAQLTLDQIPVDAPFDDAVLTVWNGDRWVAYDSWLATAPIIREESEPRPEKGTLAPATGFPPLGEERQIELPMAPEAANG